MTFLSKEKTSFKALLTLFLSRFILDSEVTHALNIVTFSSRSSPLLSSPFNHGASNERSVFSKCKQSYVSTKAGETIHDESAGFEQNNISEEEKRDNNAKIGEIADCSDQSSSQLEVTTKKKRFYTSSKIRQSQLSNRKVADTNPTIRSCLKLLIQMMRPGNFPGVILFHFIGIHRSLSLLFQHQEGYTFNLFIQTTIQPTMVATLFTLLLLVSTSMIVNDYYDARSGLDSLKFINNKRLPFLRQSRNTEHSLNTITTSTIFKPLASGEVPLHVAKQFLSMLYGVLLVTISVLPGSMTRLLGIVGSILTFYYTKHIKPRTWMKNISCAILISLAPLTSGFATLCHPFVKNVFMENSINFFTVWKGLFPIFFSLFCGFMGREIVMDCTDYDADKNAGIKTVPIVYGKKMACRFVMLMWFASGLFMTVGPIMEFYASFIEESSLSFMITPSITKLIFALIGSVSIAFRGIQLVLTEGNNEKLLQDAIEGTKTSMIFLLISSI